MPEPPLDLDLNEAEQKSLRRASKVQKQTKEPNLRDVLENWEMTDMYSPFLITNQVTNRTKLIYKKIKIILK